MRLSKERLTKIRVQNRVAPRSEQDQQEAWINVELERTMGCTLNDFSENEIDDLFEKCAELGVKAGVRKWQLS